MKKRYQIDQQRAVQEFRQLVCCARTHVRPCKPQKWLAPDAIDGVGPEP